MQLVWMIPGLAFGLYLGFAMGQWSASIFSMVSLLILGFVLLARSRAMPISDTDPVRFGGNRVAIGNRVLSRQAVTWKPELRERVWAAVEADIAIAKARLEIDQLESRGFQIGQPDSGELHFLAGFTGGKLAVLNLTKLGPHALIIGATGCGKSQLLSLILTSIQNSYLSNPPLLYLIDYKGGAALSKFTKGNNCRGFTTDLDSSLTTLLDQVLELMQQREFHLAENGSTDMTPVIVAVDEFGAALQVSGALAKFEAILARGRSLNVHLVATHQSTAGIPRALIVNFGLRFGLGRLDALDAAQLGFGAIRPSQQTLDERLMSAQILTAGNQFELLFIAPDLVPVTRAASSNSANQKSDEFRHDLTPRIRDWSASLENPFVI